MQFERELHQESLHCSPPLPLPLPIRVSSTKKNNRDRDSEDSEATSSKKKSRYSNRSDSKICGNLSQGDEEDINTDSLEYLLAQAKETEEDELFENEQYEINWPRRHKKLKKIMWLRWNYWWKKV